MQRVILILFIFLCSCINCLSQSKSNSFLKPSDTLNIPRRNAVVITEGILATSSLIALNQLWYKDYPQSRFHTIDDAGEWLQMDKIGHVYSAYQMGRVGADVLAWSGVSKKHQLLYGSQASITIFEERK